jgi:hypothetical protein
MYTDLRMFDLAGEFLSAGDDADRKSLIRKKAEWAAKVGTELGMETTFFCR